MYCPNCDSEVTTTVRTVEETYPVKGEETTILAQVRFCDCCGAGIWDDVLDNENLLRAYAVYRKRHGLLQPEEIRNIRKKYGLSQAAFAKVLGLGEKTITRYENGSLPDAAQNSLIKLVQQPGNFELLLKERRDVISEQDYASACAALKELRGSKSVVYAYHMPKYYVSSKPAARHWAAGCQGGLLCQR